MTALNDKMTVIQAIMALNQQTALEKLPWSAPPLRLSAQQQQRVYQLPPAVPKDPLPKGHKAEDLIGYRIWRLAGGGFLRSYSQPTLWLPGQPMTGKPGDHDDKGVWAFFAAEDALKKMNTEGMIDAVLGSVKLWGAVVEHTQGYRAEFARIVSIDEVRLSGKHPWSRSTKRATEFLRERYITESVGKEERLGG